MGMQADNEQLLPDPHGLVRSKALYSDCHGIRLPLNVSQSAGTLSARTVEAYHGSGLQHVAFTTLDILSAVAAARHNGVALLTIADNYYDDLASRFSLDATFVAQLKQHHILYDRDPTGGELLHVYTQPFTGGCFFFEILERRGGYHQYGAANGAARLAALYQTR